MMDPTKALSSKEILQSAVAAVHFGKDVRYRDIIKTLENIIEELEQIEE